MSSSSAAASPASPPRICWRRRASGRGARARALRADRHRAYHRASHHGHRPAPDRAGQALRPRSRAGGLGCGARGDRADRRDRSRRSSIDCDFAWVPGYLHAPVDEPARSARRRFARKRRSPRSSASTRRFVEEVPFVGGPASASTARRGSIRASIWPASRARSPARGGHDLRALERRRVLRRSAVGHSQRAPAHVRRHRARDAHPLVGNSGLPSATLFQTKLALYTSYVVAGRVEKGRFRTRCSGIPPIRITTCGSSRIATTTS